MLVSWSKVTDSGHLFDISQFDVKLKFIDFFSSNSKSPFTFWSIGIFVFLVKRNLTHTTPSQIYDNIINHISIRKYLEISFSNDSNTIFFYECLRIVWKMILNKITFYDTYLVSRKKLFSKFKRWQLPRGQDDGDSKKRLRQTKRQK